MRALSTDGVCLYRGTIKGVAIADTDCCKEVRPAHGKWYSRLAVGRRHIWARFYSLMDTLQVIIG